VPAEKAFFPQTVPWLLSQREERCHCSLMSTPGSRTSAAILGHLTTAAILGTLTTAAILGIRAIDLAIALASFLAMLGPRP
jgi:hypothetical protein